MKLKHGNNFAKRSGSIWRLLFVFALFPWLRQYRINDDKNKQLEQLSMKILRSGESTKNLVIKDAADQEKINDMKEEIDDLNRKIQILSEKSNNSLEANDVPASGNGGSDSGNDNYTDLETINKN